MIAQFALSIGAINALVPVIVILILIAAAAGLTRGSDIFRLFGVSTLLGIRTGRGTLSGKSPFKAKARVAGGGGAGTLGKLAVSPIAQGKGVKLVAGKVQNALSKSAQNALVNKNANIIHNNANILGKIQGPIKSTTGTGFVNQAVSTPGLPNSAPQLRVSSKGASTLAQSMTAKLEDTVSKLSQKGLYGDQYSIAQADQMRAEINKLHKLEQNLQKDIIENPSKAASLKKEFASDYNKSLSEVNKNIEKIANQSAPKSPFQSLGALSGKQQIAVYKYTSMEKKTRDYEIELNQLMKEKEEKQNALTRFNVQRKYESVEQKLNSQVQKIQELESKHQELKSYFDAIKATHSESVARNITNFNVGQKLHKELMDVGKFLKKNK